jgi:hypothetical protein
MLVMTMNNEKGFNKNEIISKIFNRFFWFMIIFGIIDAFVLKRVVGWVILIGGIIALISYYAKINKWGPFKPQPIIKTLPKAVETPVNVKFSIIRMITALIIICVLGLGFIYWGWNFHQQVNQTLHDKCKICSWGQKDCPYTQEELENEEWSNGPCGDMGLYELLWKGSLGLVLIGFFWIGLGISMTYSNFKELKKLKN